MSHRATGYPGFLVLAVATALAALSACTSAPAITPPPLTAPAASPSASAATPAVVEQLTRVDPSIVAGISSTVLENLRRGQYTYLNFPLVPGAEAWTRQLRKELDPQLTRFGQLASKDGKAPFPELDVNWEMIAASAHAIGVRLVTTELGKDDTFSGKVETSWWDPTTGAVRPVADLVKPSAATEFFARLRAAAALDPTIDQQQFYEQLSGDWESFNSVGFTASGALWVEFDRGQVSLLDTPVGVAVNPEGLLSDFGLAARDASLNPQDPALAPASPTNSSPRTSSTASTRPAASRVNCDKVKCVALTFDDGPVAETAALLDVLKAKGVHATFFMVGTNVAAHPGLLRRMAAEGHVLGNHTYDHPQLTRLSAASIRAELGRTSDLIQKATGVRPTVMRPPFGATNATVAGVTAQLGLAQILWNVDPLDWKDRNSATVTQRVLANTRAGSIVLSHDIHATTRKAYAAIIDGLRAKGFVLVTVPELLRGAPKPGKKYFSR